MAKTVKKAPSRAAKAAPAKSPAKGPDRAKTTSMQRVLTAEGWKRLMMAKTKKSK